MTISKSKTVTDCQDWLKPPLYPEFRKSRAPRPLVALLRGSLACKGGKLNLGARKFCGEGQRFSLTQSVDIDLCHVVAANVMEQ